MDFDKEYNCLDCPIHIKQEAYFYFPNKKEEILEMPEENKVQRFIFWKKSLNDYTEFEIKKFNEFVEYYQKYTPLEGDEQLIIPKDFTLEEAIRCIQCGHFDNEKIINKTKNEEEFFKNEEFMNVIDKFMKSIGYHFNSDKVAHDWEYYSNGVSSPSPVYPQEIHSVEEINVEIAGSSSTIRILFFIIPPQNYYTTQVITNMCIRCKHVVNTYFLGLYSIILFFSE